MGFDGTIQRMAGYQARRGDVWLQWRVNVVLGTTYVGKWRNNYRGLQQLCNVVASSGDGECCCLQLV